jgi:hypothetical protein
MSLNDQILANRQQTWKGVTKLLFWGSVESAVLTLITVLFAVNGPSVGLAVMSFFLALAPLVGAVVFSR